MRLLDLPKQMPANISEFVDGELRQYVAMSGRTMSSDFCGIGVGSGSRKRLLAVAADAGQVEEMLAIAQAAGVAVESIEPAALAYARAILTGDKSMRCNHAMLAMLTRGNLILSVFYNGALDFIRIRDVPAGMNTAQSLRVWLAEEMNAVLRYSRAGASDTDVRWSARLVVHDAAVAKDELKDLPALEPNVQALTVVDWRDPIETLTGTGGQAVLPSMIAAGAALKLLDVDTDELRIDLTPPEVIRARSSSRRGLIAANVAALAFSAVFLLIQFLAWTADGMNRRIERSRIEGQLCTLPAAVSQDQYLDGEILRMKREIAGLEAVRRRREVNWPAVLQSIGQVTPAGVGVTAMTCTDSRNLLLKGLALTHNEVKVFAERLDGQTAFATVQLSRIQRVQSSQSVVEYEINCVLKSMDQEYESGQKS